MPVLLALCFSLYPAAAPAQETGLSLEDRAEIDATLETLRSFIELAENQQEDIRAQEALLEAEESAAEQALLKQRLDQLIKEEF